MTEIDQHAELIRAGAHISSRWDAIVHFCRHRPLGAVGAAIVFVFVFVAVFADVIAPHDPLQTNASLSLLAPNLDHVMGADVMGRDMLSRIIHGARISLAVGVFSILLGGTTGVFIGLMSGFLLGWFDLLIQWVIDIMQALPLLVMALAMAASLGPSLQNTIIAISIPLMPDVARVVRSSVLSLREMPFIEAARAAGMSELRIPFGTCCPEHLRAIDRARRRPARRRDPDRGVVVVPWARHSRTAPVLGPDAVGIGGRICSRRTLAGDFPRPRDQRRGLWRQPARRRPARHSGSPAAALNILPWAMGWHSAAFERFMKFFTGSQ